MSHIQWQEAYMLQAWRQLGMEIANAWQCQCSRKERFTCLHSRSSFVKFSSNLVVCICRLRKNREEVGFVKLRCFCKGNLPTTPNEHGDDIFVIYFPDLIMLSRQTSHSTLIRFMYNRV